MRCMNSFRCVASAWRAVDAGVVNGLSIMSN